MNLKPTKMSLHFHPQKITRQSDSLHPQTQRHGKSFCTASFHLGKGEMLPHYPGSQTVAFAYEPSKQLYFLCLQCKKWSAGDDPSWFPEEYKKQHEQPFQQSSYCSRSIMKENKQQCKTPVKVKSVIPVIHEDADRKQELHFPEVKQRVNFTNESCVFYRKAHKDHNNRTSIHWACMYKGL